MKFLGAVDNAILKIEEYILSWAVIIIAIMVCGNVVSRAVTGSSWTFSGEISNFAIVIATYMGISYAARKGRHISMSAFYDLAPFKVRKVLAIFIPLVSAFILFVLTYYSYLYVLNVRDRGTVTTNLELPAYWLGIFVVLGLFMGGVQYLRNAWINIRSKEVYLGTDLKDYNDDSAVKDQDHV